MPEAASSVLSAWSNFYVITGSSAAALTGLMFVVITLIAGNRPRAATHESIATFSTPTVVHFCVALFVSAILSAPWRLLIHPAVMLGVTGLYGIAYIIHVTRHVSVVRRIYAPAFDDWIWYITLPLIGYLGIVAAAIFLPSVTVTSLFALAGATILMIFIGIHNAWDVVTFLVTDLPDDSSSSSESKEPQ
jgi:hypothetical protein